MRCRARFLSLDDRQAFVAPPSRRIAPSHDKEVDSEYSLAGRVVVETGGEAQHFVSPITIDRLSSLDSGRLGQQVGHHLDKNAPRGS